MLAENNQLAQLVLGEKSQSIVFAQVWPVAETGLPESGCVPLLLQRSGPGIVWQSQQLRRNTLSA